VEPYERPNETVSGYVPVYGSRSAAEVSFQPPRTVEDPGKIYRYGSFLLINERNKGIHVFDNADRSKPVALGFVEIIGNSDMAVRSDVLFADYMGKLVSIRTTDFQTGEVVSSLLIQDWLLGVPPPRASAFECIDQTKGIVIAWKKQTLTNPDCYAN
jgi:hypothetical protein